jgi:hypothetical protein
MPDGPAPPPLLVRKCLVTVSNANTKKPSPEKQSPNAVGPPAVQAAPATPTPPAPAPAAPPTPPMAGVPNGSTRGTKLQLQAAYSTLIAGLLAFFKPNDVFTLPLGEMTRDQLIAFLQTFVTAVDLTTSAHQAWQEALQNEHATELVVRPVRADIKSTLVGRFGKHSKTLLKFGFAPAKQAATTTKGKSTAVAKRQATRDARGTKGKKQKLAIKGNVTGVVITPVTSEASTPATNGSSAASAPAVPAVAGTPSQH